MAELQRVEKELQEKAQAQMMLTAATSNMQQQQLQRQLEQQQDGGDKAAAGQVLQPVQQQQINEVLQINSVMNHSKTTFSNLGFCAPPPPPTHTVG